jgi:hypothetical protein
LIIIATEGTDTERVYFSAMASPEYFLNSRIHVEVLKRRGTASSPDHVIKALDEFRKKYKLRRDDELWLVIDVDRWGDKKMAGIARECVQKRYLLAISNPCFELWLLLHLKSLDEYTPDTLDEFRKNAKVGHRRRLEAELVNVLGSYSKSNLNADHFLPHVEIAIERARLLDANPNHRWPHDLGTRVYLLAESVMDRKSSV